MILWKPTAEIIKNAQITRFIKSIEEKYKLTFKDFHDFRNWSVEFPAEFWKQTAVFCDINFSKEAEKILENPDQMPGAVWFSGAQLNFAQNLLRFKDDKTALIFWNEHGFQKSLTYKDLHAAVADMQRHLINAGLEKGDRVAACMPNLPESVIAMLAVTALGAVWSSCSPEFSVKAICDRFEQISPKIFLTTDGYFYKGRQISTAASIVEIKERIKSIEKVFVFTYADCAKDIPAIADLQIISDLGKEGAGQEISFEQLPSNHPLYILYSSGTTGKPKCIVHSSIGILLEHAKELVLEIDLKREDKFFYNTTCGWMMWNWLVSGLFQGATLVLFEGFPLAKEGEILFELTDKERISIFGTSAAFLQKAEALGLEPAKKYDLSCVRSVLSTGSRLKPESFDYAQKVFGKIHLSPIWGGTDLCGCLATASLVLPTRRDEIQTPGLAIDLDVVDESCKSIRGKPGEVIVRKPFPSMPLYFLNDESGEKYKKAYFEHFSGVWRHGDLAIFSKHQGISVLGRSDDTLNPAGVRIGAAEVTTAAESLSEITESMAVALKHSDDEQIILFVLLKEGSALDENLIQKIQATMPSPRHRPKRIIAVPDFPTTLSGKRSVKTVRDVINKQELSNLEALANPDSINFFKSLTEL